MKAKKFTTLSQAADRLKKRGFVGHFQFEEGRMKETKSGKRFSPNELSIVEYHHFRGKSTPTSTSSIFALVSQEGLKGILTSDYGPGLDMDFITFMDKVPVRSMGHA